MLDNIEAQFLSARVHRKVPLSNGEPTANRFDTRLPGFEMPSRPDRIATSEIDAAHPSVSRVALGQITSRRLTEIYLQRISTLNPKLLCFATVTGDRTLADADAMDTLTPGGEITWPVAWYSLCDQGSVRYQGCCDGMGG